MTRLLLMSGLVLDLVHRTDAFSGPAIVLHTESATGGFAATDARTVAAALEAGDTATFRDDSDRYALDAVTVTADTLTLRLDESASELAVTPQDRTALAEAIRATHLSPCEFVS